MRILFITGREISYPRNDVLLRALNRIDEVDVISHHQKPASLIFSSIPIALSALRKMYKNKYDIIFIGFYGYLILNIIQRFTRLPILFDAFVSNYDTLINDRNVFTETSLMARIVYRFDRYSCTKVNHILLDTVSHINYFALTFNIPFEKFSAIPVSCNEELFFPRPNLKSEGVTRVIYYSSYQPLHGVETVVRAAALLQNSPIYFHLIGNGPTYPRIRRLADRMKLENIDFKAPIPISELPAEIASADIFLGGHFGVGAKAARVIPGKIYQGLAMAKPVIAGDSPANLELLQHGESGYICSMGNPEALASSINQLHEDNLLRERISQGGRELFRSQCSEGLITKKLLNIVEGL